MGIGVSLLLIAVGAVLTWAVTATTSGLDVNAVGVLLMVVGFVGLVISMVFWSTWLGPGYFRTYVADGPTPQRRRRPARGSYERAEAEETVEEIVEE
jgi:hypothetical protein